MPEIFIFWYKLPRGLQSRSLQAQSDKLLHFQGFADGGSQIIAGDGLLACAEETLLLQLRTQQNAERQAEIRILEIAAEQLRDVRQPV